MLLIILGNNDIWELIWMERVTFNIFYDDDNRFILVKVDSQKPSSLAYIVKILEEYWVLAPQEIEVGFSPIDAITWVLMENK